MKRAALEKSRTKNVWRKHYQSHIDSLRHHGGRGEVECVCDVQVGRFRKGQRAFVCGNLHCMGCGRGDKFAKAKGEIKPKYKAVIATAPKRFAVNDEN